MVQRKKRYTSKKRSVLRRRRLLVLLAALVVGRLLLWTWQVQYPIKRSQLQAFGWRTDFSWAEIYQLNHLLRKYQITSKPSITMFFATAASETDKGRLTLEEGGEAYYQSRGYAGYERGAGYLQMTHRELQLEFLRAMGDKFDGTDTASYIAKRYPWESACWMWSVGKTSPAPNPNRYAKEKGNRKEVFLATQYGINGWRISDAAMRAIVEGESYQISADGKTVSVLGEQAPTPINWKNRVSCYEQAYEIWGK